MIIVEKAHARAGLMGNPSDAYFGKTISFTMENFYATVTMFASPELRIEPHRSDENEFDSVDAMIENVKLSGYYGGVRLIKATIVRFNRYVKELGLPPLEQPFTVRYESTIPQRVGLAGSSAIITATFRALCRFYSVNVSWPVMANLILESETNELGIPAGLQDRVVQVYEGMVYMDFSREYMEDYGHGKYSLLDPKLMPPVYVAYSDKLGEGTEVFHSTLRERFDRGEKTVRDAMKQFARLTMSFKRALDEGNNEKMNSLVNKNFDLRASISKISDNNWELINTVRNAGGSAKFAGSGGAIVGFYRDDEMFKNIASACEAIGAKAFKPVILPPRTPDEMEIEE